MKLKKNNKKGFKTKQITIKRMETKFDIKTKRNKIVRVKMKNIDSKKDSKRKNSIENHVWEKRKKKLQDTANLDERRGRRRENMKNRSHTLLIGTRNSSSRKSHRKESNAKAKYHVPSLKASIHVAKAQWKASIH
jgi:hypothetical protein